MLLCLGNEGYCLLIKMSVFLLSSCTYYFALLLHAYLKGHWVHVAVILTAGPQWDHLLGNIINPQSCILFSRSFSLGAVSCHVVTEMPNPEFALSAWSQGISLNLKKFCFSGNGELPVHWDLVPSGASFVEIYREEALPFFGSLHPIRDNPLILGPVGLA